jgi:branched-chain amino acid transport system substrate-binding protein
MKQSSKTITMLAVVLLASFFVFSHAALAAEAVNIGVIYPLTGAAGFVGQDALRGIELAADQMNSQGGIKVGGKSYVFKIRSYDDEATPAKSVVGLQKLKDLYDIPVVIMMFSGPSLAVIENNAQLGVLWTGMSMHPNICKVGNPLVIRHNCPITDTAKAVAKRIVAMGFKTCAHLCSIDDWGRNWDTQVTQGLEGAGAKVLTHEWLDERTHVDFRSQLTKIKALNSDALFVAAHDEVAAMITLQARELGLKIPIIHSEGFQAKGWEIVGPAKLDGVYYTNNSGLPVVKADYPKKWTFSEKAIQYMNANPNVAREAYAEAFKKKFPDVTMAAYGYASYENVWALMMAMEKGQTVKDPHKIRKSMYEVMPLPKVRMTMGVIGYTPEGDGIMAPEIMGFREGVWRFPKEMK